MGNSSRNIKAFQNLDWLSIFLYLILVIMGWFTIFAAVYNEEAGSITDITQRYGKQLIWMGIAFLIATVILLTDSKFFTTFSMPLYILMLLVLILLVFVGKEVKGARAWFELGSLKIQPGEFAKVTTALALAYIMSRPGFRIMRMRNLLTACLVVLLPAFIIILQNDTGSALVFSAFIVVMYREGLYGTIPLLLVIMALIFIFSLLYPPVVVITLIVVGSLVTSLVFRQRFSEVNIAFWMIAILFALFAVVGYFWKPGLDYALSLILAYGIVSIFALIYIWRKRIKRVIPVILISWLCIFGSYGVNFAFSKLQPHQQERINLLLGKTYDPQGIGYNVMQSKIAIGSGGLVGKGFLQGTQTKYNFVPEQSTDFIFCTIGEERGFIGSTIVIALLFALILRIVRLAERQKSNFSRIYGYGVASILFFHVVVNIGMTLDLLPVIGIPLPFFSYGGSSLWAFTILIFIFLKLDSNRTQVLS